MIAGFLVLLVCFVVFGGFGVCSGDALKNNFYKKSCHNVEKIVNNITWTLTKANPVLGAKLLRLYYHDCFVRFQKPIWEVLTGRRDGSFSLASELTVNLPSPFTNFTTLKKLFLSKLFNVNDLVALSGAHTIGVAHCGTFARRLNLTGNGDVDPSLEPFYADFLKKKCPTPPNPATTVEMDPRSSLSFDNHYFTNLDQNKGLFQSDAAVLTNKDSSKIVQESLSFPGPVCSVCEEDGGDRRTQWVCR